MLQPKKTKQYLKDEKRARRQKKKISPLIKIMQKLIHERPISAKHCDHPLKRNWKVTVQLPY